MVELQKQKLLEEELTKKVDVIYNEKLKEAQNITTTAELNDNPTIKNLFFKYLGVLQENRNIAKDKLLMQHKLDALQAKLESSLHSRSSLFKQISLITEQTKKQEDLIQKLVAENKSILEQHQTSIEQEHKRREDIQKGFQSAIDEIHVKLQEQANERMKVMKENELMNIQVETMTKQMELREKQFEAELRKAELEKQLVKHKMEEKLKENAKGEEKLIKLKKKLELKSQEANEYKKQLNQYSSKYVEIQKTIKESNKTFELIKSELAKLKAKNEQLEKEKAELKKMVKEARMTGISSPKNPSQENLSAIAIENNQRKSIEMEEVTPKVNEEHGIDIAATPKTIIDIQTPIIFSPTKVNEDIRASRSLLQAKDDVEDLNDVDL
jgi:myosin heavy subunit